jgi:hypothetical protein
LVVVEHLVNKLGGCHRSSGHGEAYFGFVGTASKEGRQYRVDMGAWSLQQQSVDIWEILVPIYSTQTMQVLGKVNAVGVSKGLVLARALEIQSGKMGAFEGPLELRHAKGKGGVGESWVLPSLRGGVCCS